MPVCKTGIDILLMLFSLLLLLLLQTLFCVKHNSQTTASIKLKLGGVVAPMKHYCLLATLAPKVKGHGPQGSKCAKPEVVISQEPQH